ncbi:benzoate/H(+) symporter BenE family transporter [Luteolibacter yonseiensis]|uniref:Benzoate/H(+) symporter BenE family transporter n=1 Tax=Luteolibacter yonseiensis TaxID=1144680 RepID=A0A934R461_9BACT|nr:benzoate/H(+) symporter BenE family transporter [Luteolibacter yonseiensis]MBK1814945.1 benzoate/H(+) symporter BenE family transporter [Luteolibacter yonseiensis]
MFKDFSISAVVAGFVAVLVGFTSSVAVIFQATQNLHATPGQTASWLWALGIGMAVPSIILSYIHRLPILIAWSTPGAAVIAGAAADGHLTLPQATGAFLACALMIAVAGFSRGFEKIMNRLPLPLASALLAGVLSKFALDAFIATPANPWLVLPMFAACLLGRNFWPRWNVPVILLLGVGIAILQNRFNAAAVPLEITRPVWVTPEFSLRTLVGVALPLFLVTMASQNLPGIAVFKANGYEPPVSRIIGWSGVANLLVAPFGGFTLNLAAITAAFCMNAEAHPEPGKRYVAAMSAGFFYGLVGVFGATIAGLFAAFPHELVLAVAGLALLGTIANGIAAATAEERYREASMISFFVVLSGISFGGIGSAFWGIVAGVLSLGVRKARGN